MAATGIYKLYKGYTDGSMDKGVQGAWTRLCKRSYHLHCTIENATDKEIKLIGNKHMSSGDIFIVPADEVQPRSNMTFGVGGGSYSGDALRSFMMGGVSGGIAFRITGGPEFAVGFTDPLVGARKAGVALSSSGEAGYDAASGDGNSVQKDGYKITATINSDKRVAWYKVERV